MSNYQMSRTGRNCRESSEKGDFFSLNRLERVLKRRENPVNSNKYQAIVDINLV